MIRYYKGDPNAHILAFRNGQVVREGAGLSFLYLPVRTTVARVPTVATVAPFLITETTRDYQEIAIQGTLTYRITEPARAAGRLDFTVDPATGKYRTEDPAKLIERIVNAAQARARGVVRTWTLEETLDRAQALAESVTQKLRGEEALAELGVVVDGVYVIGVKAKPEVHKALEAQYRESVNRRADEAIYQRRAAALEQEHELKRRDLNTKIEAEERRKELVAKEAENDLTQARAAAQADELKLSPYARIPTQALIAMAVKQWAANPAAIGQLNITPDMLTQMAGWLSANRAPAMPAPTAA